MCVSRSQTGKGFVLLTGVSAPQVPLLLSHQAAGGAVDDRATNTGKDHCATVGGLLETPKPAMPGAPLTRRLAASRRLWLEPCRTCNMVELYACSQGAKKLYDECVRPFLYSHAAKIDPFFKTTQAVSACCVPTMQSWQCRLPLKSGYAGTQCVSRGVCFCVLAGEQCCALLKGLASTSCPASLAGRPHAVVVANAGVLLHRCLLLAPPRLAAAGACAPRCIPWNRCCLRHLFPLLPSQLPPTMQPLWHACTELLTAASLKALSCQQYWRRHCTHTALFVWLWRPQVINMDVTNKVARLVESHGPAAAETLTNMVSSQQPGRFKRQPWDAAVGSAQLLSARG